MLHILASAANSWQTFADSSAIHLVTVVRQDFYPVSGWATILGAQTDLAALERLLTRYRGPILLEMQSRAHCSSAEAEELTHQFIHNCLRRDFLKNVDPEKGRFRSFIKVCITNFLRDLHRRRKSEPNHISLDETDREGHSPLDPADETCPPDSAADAHWARRVLALSLEQLEAECVAARRGPLFTALKPFLHGDPPGEGYARISAQLRMKEGALRTATHRMRQRLGELIEDEIKQTVGNRADWREELRYFLDLLGHSP